MRCRQRITAGILALLCLFMTACGPQTTVIRQEEIQTEETASPAEENTEPETESTTEAETETGSRDDTQNTESGAGMEYIATTSPARTEETTEDGDEHILTREEIVQKNPQMATIMDVIGPYVDICGFAYDEEQDIFYSTLHPIQKLFGFNDAYDFFANRFGLYYNTRIINFNYNGKDWRVQFWKGQYGITVGGEVGVYYKDEDKIIPHYETVSDDDFVMMGFTLYKNGKEYLHRDPEKHWWSTGFKLLDVAVMLQLSMAIYFDWEDKGLADAFEEGIKKEYITDITYLRKGTEFWVSWTV